MIPHTARPGLSALIEEAAKRVEAMPAPDREAMLAEQRASWARGEIELDRLERRGRARTTYYVNVYHDGPALAWHTRQAANRGKNGTKPRLYMLVIRLKDNT